MLRRRVRRAARPPHRRAGAGVLRRGGVRDADRAHARRPDRLRAALRRANWQILCSFKILAKFAIFLAGSFSAVAKRYFARKYMFDSIFHALQDLHTLAPVQSQNFRKKSV